MRPPPWRAEAHRQYPVAIVGGLRPALVACAALERWGATDSQMSRCPWVLGHRIHYSYRMRVDVARLFADDRSVPLSHQGAGPRAAPGQLWLEEPVTRHASLVGVMGASPS